MVIMYQDQSIAEIDSDKATLELPAEESCYKNLNRGRGDCFSWRCRLHY